jgi:predicted peroxiredoxin
MALSLKLHSSLFAVVQKLQRKEMLLNPAETPFIRDGKAEVQVWLSEKTDEAFAQLKELGFELVLDPKSSKMIIGRLPVEKLEALAKLKFVKYVAPAALK